MTHETKELTAPDLHTRGGVLNSSTQGVQRIYHVHGIMFAAKQKLQLQQIIAPRSVQFFFGELSSSPW